MKLLAGFGLFFGALALAAIAKTSIDNLKFGKYTRYERDGWDVAVLICGVLGLAGLFVCALIIAGVIR